ncbi:MAG: copper chaperone PCu(A)C [Paracoccaceae bacterium]
MKTIILAALGIGLATTALAEIQIHDAYARSGVPGARTGGAYMEIHNTGPEDDRLIGIKTDIAQMNQIHNNIITDGVAQMVEAKGGIAIAAGETHRLARGGDHLMFMGLSDALEQGDMLDIILIFEHAGEIALQIPVDYTRSNDEAHGTDHSHN